MAVKYFIRYNDIIGVEHQLDIYDDIYVDQPIQVDGKITLTYSETDDSLEAIRGQGLSVELEADETLTFNDLWSEDEKTFKVIYTRANTILFQSSLNPEGWFENWVDTDWIITFDCVDGLGYLKDLSFVYENGLPITGRKKYIELLALALLRTGLAQPIYTDIEIRYIGLSDTLNILDNVFVNSERYIKDDGKTIMDCDAVIRDILEPFGAVLTSFNGKWFIYKPNQLYFNTGVLFNVYSYLGVNLFQEFPFDFGLNIGSEINDYNIHHCSANQSIRNVSSIGAYRISYKYGLVKTLIDNIYLYSYDGGLSIEDYYYYSTFNLSDGLSPISGILDFRTDGRGIIFSSLKPNDIILQLRNEPIALDDLNLQIDILIRYFSVVTRTNIDVGYIPKFNYKVI